MLKKFSFIILFLIVFIIPVYASTGSAPVKCCYPCRGYRNREAFHLKTTKTQSHQDSQRDIFNFLCEFTNDEASYGLGALVVRSCVVIYGEKPSV